MEKPEKSVDDVLEKGKEDSDSNLESHHVATSVAASVLE